MTDERDGGNDKKRGRLRSLSDRLPERGPVQEDLVFAPEGPQRRITWPVAFIIATIVICLTVVYIMSKWPEWQCKREGGVWYPASEGSQLPDNFCDRPGPD